MITISYEQLNKPAFLSGINKLANTDFHLQTGYMLGKINEKVKQHLNGAKKEWVELLTTKVEWEGEGLEKKPKDEQALVTLEKDFLQKTFTIEKNKIHVQDIHVAKLTPEELLALEPVLTGFETLEEGDKNGEKETN